MAQNNTDSPSEAKTGEYGKPIQFDPDFHGPVTDRSCTDITCCLLFMLCIIGAAVCSAIGYTRGDPKRLVYPRDTGGQFCGHGDLRDKPFLFFFDLLQCANVAASVLRGCPTPQVRVSHCPNESFVYLESVAIEESGNPKRAREKLICKPGVDPLISKQSIQYFIESGQCAAYYVKSTPVINRCIPAIFNQLFDKADQLNTTGNFTLINAFGDQITGVNLENGIRYIAKFFKLKGYAEMVYSDLAVSWPQILVGLLLAMMVALSWMVLLRLMSGVMVWLTLALFAAVFVFCSYYSLQRYYELGTHNVTAELGLPRAFVLNFEYYLTLRETWLAFGCISVLALVIFAVTVTFLARQIILAIQLIKEASRTISKMTAVLFWPIVPFMLQLILLAYWVTTALYIGSLGEEEYFQGNFTNITTIIANGDVKALLNRVPCDPLANITALGDLCHFVKYGGTNYSTALQLYMLFMFLWMMNVVVALGQMTLAGALASYYWTRDKDKDLPVRPVLRSFHRCLRYHLGSLALGSLVMALVKMGRAVLEYVDRTLRGSENRISIFVLKCLKCCFWCLENVLKFINNNAYIMIAIYGRNFCTATKDAFMLVMRNVLRMFVIDKVTDFLMLIGQLMVTAAVALAAFFWFDGDIPVLDNYVPQLQFHLLPVIVLVVGTYLMTSCFFNVYDVAVGTLFLCCMEDMERNDGSASRPYYMTDGLMRALRRPKSEAV